MENDKVTLESIFKALKCILEENFFDCSSMRVAYRDDWTDIEFYGEVLLRLSLDEDKIYWLSPINYGDIPADLRWDKHLFSPVKDLPLIFLPPNIPPLVYIDSISYFRQFAEYWISCASEIFEKYRKKTTPKKKATGGKDRNKGERIFDAISDYTVIDLETTSKYPTKAEITEMAAVRVRSGKIVSEYSQLVKPSVPIPVDVTRITGITNRMVEHSPAIGEVLHDFLDFIGNDVVVGHNIVTYDSTILYDLCEQYGLRRFNNTMLDTLYYSQHCDMQVTNHKLTTIAEYLGIEYQAHRALNDCIANFQVYECLKGYYQENFVFKPQKIVTTIVGINSQYAELSGKKVVLTGEFSSGERKDITSYLESQGAKMMRNVSGNTDYLIIGNLGNPDWKYGDYGDKTAKAQEYQKKGKNIQIVQESDFFDLETKVGVLNG